MTIVTSQILPVFTVFRLFFFTTSHNIVIRSERLRQANNNNNNNNNKVYLSWACPYINMFALGTLQSELRQKR